MGCESMIRGNYIMPLALITKRIIADHYKASGRSDGDHRPPTYSPPPFTCCRNSPNVFLYSLFQITQWPWLEKSYVMDNNDSPVIYFLIVFKNFIHSPER